MTAENMPVSPVTLENLPSNKGSGGLTAKEFAAIQLSVPMSGTEWLDKMINESNAFKHHNAIHIALIEQAYSPADAANRTMEYMDTYVKTNIEKYKHDE